MERGSVTKSHEGKNAYVEKKVWGCFQWKAHGQSSKGDSCSFSHDTKASGNSGAGKRRRGRSSSPASHSKAKKATERKVLTREIRLYADTENFLKKKNRRVNSGILPCVRITGLKKGCIYGDKCRFRHVDAEEQPNKKSKKGGAKGSVAILNESTQLGCVSQDS